MRYCGLVPALARVSARPATAGLDSSASLCARGAARGTWAGVVLRSFAVRPRAGWPARPATTRRMLSARPMRSPCNSAARTCGSPAFAPCRRSNICRSVPQFTEHYFESDDEGDESIDNGPTGGLTWDGRVDRGRDQARIPLLVAVRDGQCRRRRRSSPRCAQASYAERVRKHFRRDVFADPDKAFAAVIEALEVYQQNFREFYPYSSKYDAYLAGRRALTAQEARGLALFNDPAKGNCANCHRSARGKDGTPPQFTDYGLIALGVPRNRDIPANADPEFFRSRRCAARCAPISPGTATIAGGSCTPTLAQRRAAADLLPQRHSPQPARGDRVLCRARYRSGQMVPARRRRATCKNSTICRRLLGQCQHRAAVRRQARRSAHDCRRARSTTSSPFSRH